MALEVSILTRLFGTDEVKRQLAGLSRDFSTAGGFAKTAAVNITGFNQGLSGLARQGGAVIGTLGSIALKMGALAGIGGAAGLVVATKQAITFGDEIAKTASKIGVTTDTLQELTHAAKLSGVEQGSLTTSLSIFTRTIGNAAAGNKEAASAFARLGISIKDSGGQIKPTSAILSDVADRISKIGSESQRNAALTELFGRSGIEMANLLKEGSKGLAEAADEAHRLGLVFSEDLLRQTEQAADGLDRMEAIFGYTLKRALLGFMPVINQLSDYVVENADEIQAWASNIADKIPAAAEKAGKAFKFIAENLDEIGKIGRDALILRIGMAFGPWGALAAAASVGILRLKEAMDEFGPVAERVFDAFITFGASEGMRVMLFLKDELFGAAEGADELAGSLGNLNPELENTGTALRRGSPLFAEAAEGAETLDTAVKDLAATTLVLADYWRDFGLGLGTVIVQQDAVTSAVERESTARMASILTLKNKLEIDQRVEDANEKMERDRREREEAEKRRADEAKRRAAETEKIRLGILRGEVDTQQAVMATARAHNIAATAERVRNQDAVTYGGKARHAAILATSVITQQTKALEEQKREIDALSYNVEYKLKSAWKSAGDTARDYFTTLRDSAKNAENAMLGVLNTVQDQLTEFFKTGKFSVKDFFESLKHEMANFAAREVMGTIGGILFGSGGGTTLGGPGGTGANSANVVDQIIGGIGSIFGGGGKDTLSGGAGNDNLAGGSGSGTGGGGLISNIFSSIFGNGGGAGGDAGGGLFGSLGGLGSLLSLGGMVSGNPTLSMAGMGLGLLGKLPAIGNIFGSLGSLGGGPIFLGGGGGATLGGLGSGGLGGLGGLMGLAGPLAIFGGLAAVLKMFAGKEEKARMGGSAGFKWGKGGYAGSTLAASWSGVNGAALKKYADVVGKAIGTMEKKGLIDVKDKLGGYVSLVINEDTGMSSLGFSTRPMKSILGKDLGSFMPLGDTKQLLNAVLAFNVQAGNIDVLNKKGGLEKYIAGLKGQGLSTFLATQASNSRTAFRLPNGEISFMGGRPNSDNAMPGGSNLDAIRGFASGGEGFFTAPTTIRVAENGPEHVQVGRMGGMDDGGITINIGGVIASDMTVNMLTRRIRQEMAREGWRTRRRRTG